MAKADSTFNPRPVNIDGTSGDDNLTGTSGADTIHGNSGNDTIDGLGGNDTLYGDEGDDIIFGRGQDDFLFGGTGNDTLDGGSDGGDQVFGEAGNDILTGHRGLLSGGTGDDQYFVYSQGVDAPTVVEALGEGFDTLYTRSSWTLQDNQEIEVMASYQPFLSVSALVLTGNGLANIIYGGPERNVLNGGGANDQLYGLGGADIMNGGSGDDTTHGDLAFSSAFGGSGSDTFHANIYDLITEFAGEGSDRILSPTGFDLGDSSEVEILEAADLNATTSIRFSGNGDANILRGNAGANMLAGRGGPDVLYGNGGDDIIDGGAGSDLLEGGAGIDVFAFTTAIGSNNIDQVTDFLVGTDKIALSLQIFTGLSAGTLPAGAFATGSAAADADDRILYDPATGALRFDADGNGAGGAIQFATLQAGLALSAADFIVVSGTQIANGSDPAVNLTGTGGRDILMGGRGNDTINGGEGPDVLIGGNGNDLLTGGGTNAVAGLGDTLFGEEGDDVLDGGLGPDRMYGGRGNDTFFIDDRSSSGDLGSNVGDTVFEAPGEGLDTLNVSVEYTLPDYAEIEVINSSTMALVRGNAIANTMTGNNLNGGGGNDVLIAVGNGSLRGAEGDDILIGSVNDDYLAGGTGNDTFYVQNNGDFVDELAGEGNDRLVASVSYALYSGSEVETIETLQLSGTGAINLTGSNSANTIIGNAGVNFLDGSGGADTLIAAAGNDFLIGGAGADAMYGGLGDDTYYVDDVGDTANEAAGEGSDRVATLVSFSIASSAIEVLEATNSISSNAMDLTGNALDNVVAGNNGVNVINGGAGNDVLAGYAGADTLNGADGNDVLIGGSGNDSMSGGIGNDKYYVEDTGDVTSEAAGQGSDAVATNVSYTLPTGSEIENLEPITLSGTEALNLTGNEFVNAILGNNGANTINGGAGNDVLEGLGGQDLFAFTTALGANNVDRINDYLSSFDRFVLDHNVFTGLTPGGLPAGAFVSGSAAADSDDRIIYNPATGAVLFDVDGNGAMAAVQFATIGTGLNLTAGDFLVI